MDGVDSPLEVLSLAATMVQGSALPPSYEEARKALPSARWRRDRRARDLPDYAAAQTAPSPSAGDCHGAAADGPLDMSTRSRVSQRTADRAAARAKLAQASASARVAATPPPPPGRGSPPSYSEAISKSGYRRRGTKCAWVGNEGMSWSEFCRPSVITCAPASPTPSPAPSKGSEKAARTAKAAKAARSEKAAEAMSDDGMCDPVIDEHFRRSLGKDYLTLFAKKTTSSKASNDKEDEDSNGLSITGLSVDDHFAKALGDTWLKLQADSASSSLPPVPSKSASKAKEAANSTITRQRRGLVTI